MISAAPTELWNRAQIASFTIQAILTVFAAMTAIYAAIPSLRAGVWTMLPGLLVIAFARWLVWVGKIGLATWIVLLTTEASITVAAFTGGGFETGVPVFFTIGAALGALLAGPVWGLLLTTYGICVVLAVYVLGSTDQLLLIDTEPKTIRFALNFAVTLLVGWTMSFTIGRLRNASTEARQNASALARARDYADDLVQCMAEPVLVADGIGIVLQANDAALDLLDRSRPALLGTAISSLVSIETRARWTLSGATRAEGRVRASDGTLIPVDISFSRMLDPDGEVREVVVASDIRLRVEAQRRVEEAARAAQEATRAKSAFLAGISHELRTPLNAILGFAEILGEDLSGPPAEDAHRIHRSGKLLLTLINDILDLSKIEAGRMELRLEDLDVRKIVSEIVSELSPQAAERDNALEIETNIEQIPWHSDRLKLQHVIHNLLSNAIKFTEAGHVKLSVTQTPSELSIVVTDTGIGIAQERLELLFQPFSQGDPSPLRRYGGSGLGLAVSSAFVRMLSGTIDVSSEIGAGSTFSARLPALPR